jgi:pimeloyl-ACP methyl ester carboxylesterase
MTRFILLLLLLSCLDLYGQTSYDGLDIKRDTTFFVPSLNGRVTQNGSGRLYDHFLYLPSEYDPQVQIPLVIDLHGTGQSGITGFMKDVSLGRKLPFIVLGPNSGTVNGFYNTLALDSLINQAVEYFNIDTNKIYLTGISRGAMAAADYVSHFPNKIAALALFAGQVSPEDDFQLTNLKETPVWIVNGEFDFLEGFKVHDGIREIQSAYSRYNWVFNEEHDENGWQDYYQNKRLEKWLLAQDLQEAHAYELEMVNKNHETISLGFFHKGSEVNIYAPLADNGHQFLKWYNNNGGTFSDDQKPNTQFNMPGYDARVFPTYSNIPCFLSVENGVECGGLRIDGYTTLSPNLIDGLEFSHWESNVFPEIPKPWQSRLSVFDAKTIYVKDTCAQVYFRAVYDTLKTPILRNGHIISANFIGEDFFGVQAKEMYEADFAGANASNWWNNLKINSGGGQFSQLKNDSNEITTAAIEISIDVEDGASKRSKPRSAGADRLMLFTNQFLGNGDQTPYNIQLKGTAIPFSNYQLIVYLADQNNFGNCSIQANLGNQSFQINSPNNDESFYSENWFTENINETGNMLVFNNLNQDSFALNLLVSPNQSDTRLAISGIQIIDGSVATTDLEKNKTFTLYPNPNQGILNINPVQHEPILITIYDVMGKKVYSEKIYNRANLDLIDGYYFVKITNDRGRFIEPLIITRQ